MPPGEIPQAADATDVAGVAEVRELVQSYLQRLALKVEAVVRQPPLLAEEVDAGLRPCVALRSRRCRDFLLGGATQSADGCREATGASPEDSAAAHAEDCADACLLHITETLLVHYTKRAPAVAQKAGSTLAPDASAGIDEKYWKRRYNYFSRFDEGVRMDPAGWFEVTPESVARHIADRMKYGLVVDGTCGVGGNAIQFALSSDRVIAVDLDKQRLEDAQHNAGLYGVDKKIEFVHDNFVHWATTYDGPAIDAVFLSPPWGGPAHLDADYFSLRDVDSCDIAELFSAATKVSSRVVLYMPRHQDLHEMAILGASHGFGAVEVEKILFQYPTPHLKLVVLYFTPEAATFFSRCNRQRQFGNKPTVKKVGASARGKGEGDSAQERRGRERERGMAKEAKAKASVSRKKASVVAEKKRGEEKEEQEAASRESWGLLHLPPLAGPLIRSMYCRVSYLGKYVVAAALSIERQEREALSASSSRCPPERIPSGKRRAVGASSRPAAVAAAPPSRTQGPASRGDRGRKPIQARQGASGGEVGGFAAANGDDLARTLYETFARGGGAAKAEEAGDEVSEHMRLLAWLVEDEEVPWAQLMRLGSDALLASKDASDASAWSREFFAALRLSHPQAHQRLLERHKTVAAAAIVSPGPTPTSGGA
eukprot:TRINITY_DN31624_c0_g1_i1.p1 TRINITY_DN31624_c0_g1~~TRINITY_DN31624_c0_g1_i1.p1  ORF type:complete len:654 (-),score=179.14 TRINITY_DN31624_c0_g1_i1:43-2004(-)